MITTYTSNFVEGKRTLAPLMRHRFCASVSGRQGGVSAPTKAQIGPSVKIRPSKRRILL